ncbi:hypothetical protein dqs_3591 [Azoarcus olearius]|nr:hypothetical protein dqs_3591 [Azoarcus olearius]
MSTMKTARQTLFGLAALALTAIAPVAQAAPVWMVNPEGTGAAGASALQTLGVAGVGFVQLTPDAANPANFTFVEYGAYRAVKGDGTTPYGSNDLTIRYTVSGSGSFLNPASIGFSSGSVEIYSDAAFDYGTSNGTYGADNGTLIAKLSVVGGNTDTTTGAVTISAGVIPGSMLAGYFFDAAGNDLAGFARVLFSMNLRNQFAAPEPLLVSEIVCEMAGHTGAGCDGTPFLPTQFAFLVRDSGFATVQVVPEPPAGGLALAAVGLLGFTLRRRGKR